MKLFALCILVSLAGCGGGGADIVNVGEHGRWEGSYSNTFRGRTGTARMDVPPCYFQGSCPNATGRLIDDSDNSFIDFRLGATLNPLFDFGNLPILDYQIDRNGGNVIMTVEIQNGGTYEVHFTKR